MSNENLKSNVVDSRTLFIGVGGIGGSIVRMVAEMCRPGETENINFVCMDTNVNDLKSVMQSGAQIYSVQTSSTQTVGNYLNYDADALQNWFPKNQVMYDKSVSEGAGQVRAISRLALNATIKSGRIAPLYQAIDDLFRKDGAPLKQAMRVVIVSSASGGTGSGMILPLAMLVRDYVNTKYPNSATIIRATLLLPETLDREIKSNAEKDSQRRNAYATIKEINAFMMKGTGIFDTDESLARFRDLHLDITSPNSSQLRSLSLLPCDFCFLVDGQNSDDSTMTSLDQYKRQTALALYEQNIGPMQRQAFSVEDNVIKEFTSPGNFARNRFGGIGSAIARYPYDDVARYISYGWAMDSIGGEAEAAKWYRYDKKYEEKRRSARKKNLPQSSPDFPVRASVYVSELKNGKDKFSKDLMSQYALDDAEADLPQFFTEFINAVTAAVNGHTGIMNAQAAANALSSALDYTKEENQGQATANKELLRRFELIVRQYAAPTARTAAESICYNETKTINELEPYTLEYLFKTPSGDIYHPNAIRYMLYLLQTELDTRINTADSMLKSTKDTLADYSATARRKGKYNIKATKDVDEETLDALCAAEGTDKRGDTEVHEKLNKYFPAYYRSVTDLANQTAEYEALRVLKEYVKQLSDGFERFYQTFGSKVTVLERKRSDLVADLRFKKGDSVLNICASQEVLSELEKITLRHEDDDTMLDSALCGEIFDAVKTNVAVERENQFADAVENDRRVDIFDDILLGYFERSVRDTAEAIDMNIIEAIAMENRLKVRSKMRQEQERSGKTGETLYDNVTVKDNERYISSVLARVQRLAAPSIQGQSFAEPRDINLCAYNVTLNDMRAYDVSALLPSGTDKIGTDTVSRYEFHFFNALYNLSPDKLNKFACAKKFETGDRDGGLYHEAYIKYAKNIGPDSTKDLLPTTHIDKRWDSIAVLPELDFDYQAQQTMEVFQAMIYALVHRSIIYRNPSRIEGGKKVYFYENSSEHLMDLVVPNGTRCDEFYEILDSFYISSAVVEDMKVIRERKRARDKDRSSNYVDTTFAQDLAELNIECLHEGATSLFEIPLAYCNSLPNSRRYRDEIAVLVSAVVKTFRDEVFQWENGADALAILRIVLLDQFRLFLSNYKTYETLNEGVKAQNNMVVDIIFRQIKAVLNEDPEPADLAGLIQQLKDLIQNPEA